MKPRDTAPQRCRHRWKLDSRVYGSDWRWKLQRSCAGCGAVMHAIASIATAESVPRSLWHLLDVEWCTGKYPAPAKPKCDCAPHPCVCYTGP